MIRMVFFAPYPEILPVIRQVFSERPDREEFHYEVVQDFFNNPLENINADVAIARGFTAHSMQKKGIICTELRVTGYDVIAAIDICLKLTPVRKIAIVGAFNMVYGAENAGSIYPDIEITCYPILDETRLDEMIQKAIADGNGAIVGGYTTVMLAKAYQIPTVMIKSGREAVNNAIAEARIAAEISFREKERSNEIANIMNYSFQGIMSTDRQGMITFANSYCHTLLKDVKSSFLRHSIREYFPSVPVEHVISDGRKILSDLQYYHDLPLLVNCVPIEGEYDNAGCVLTFQNAAQIQAEEGQIRKKMHPSGFKAKYHFSQIVHNSPIMDAVILDAVNFSYSDSNILIYGETGTGKELFAQSIHNASPCSKGPFVTFDCAAHSPEQEAALSRAGKAADTGTLYLDNLDQLTPGGQRVLCRLLREGVVHVQGEDTPTPVAARVIGSLTGDLAPKLEAGVFQPELYYLLTPLRLSLPPLRTRPDDLNQAIDMCLDDCVVKFNRYVVLTREARRLLMDYPWPGNYIQLRAFLERMVLTAPARTVNDGYVRSLLEELYPLPVVRAHGQALPAAVSPEAARLAEVLSRNGGSRAAAAAELGISKTTLWRRMKQYGIRDRFEG